MEPDRADQYLIDRIRDGSESAWRQLIARYEGRLLAFARVQTPSLADAEDLVQETFVGLCAFMAPVRRRIGAVLMIAGMLFSQLWGYWLYFQRKGS